MAQGKWVAYYRVSTDRQGKSGLGLEGQRAAVIDFLNGGHWKVAKEFTEVESGKRSDRPMLEASIRACRLYGAKLVIAKLDRLSRDAHFLLGLEKAGVDFVAADMPNANRLTVGIMAMVARAGLTGPQGTRCGSCRLGGLKSGLRASRDHAAEIAPTIAELRAAGITSLQGIARQLNEAGIPTPRGQGRWSAVQVGRIIERS
jgi:DNA invertase Pin-like site-specific DNA recombinase